MRRRPLALFLSALLFFYFPLSLLWNWQQGEPPEVLDVILSGVLPVLLVVGLLRVSRVGWYTLIALVALWGVRDLYDYYAANDQSWGPLVVHIAIYCFSLGYFINPRVRHLYFDPALRWWRTKPRYETHIPLIVKTRVEGSVDEEWNYPILRNISEGGCFVETSKTYPSGTMLQLAVPLPVPLNVSVIQTEGEVRWVSDSPVRPGMGVQFNTPPPAQDRAIKEYVRRQL